MPEIAPDAPTTGTMSSGLARKWNNSETATAKHQNRTNRTTPSRFASGDPKAASQIMLMIRCIQPPCKTDDVNGLVKAQMSRAYCPEYLIGKECAIDDDGEILSVVQHIEADQGGSPHRTAIIALTRPAD
jgi:hypothetical protein